MVGSTKGSWYGAQTGAQLVPLPETHLLLWGEKTVRSLIRLQYKGLGQGPGDYGPPQNLSSSRLDFFLSQWLKGLLHESQDPSLIPKTHIVVETRN